jgi:hypothetical protein
MQDLSRLMKMPEVEHDSGQICILEENQIMHTLQEALTTCNEWLKSLGLVVAYQLITCREKGRAEKRGEALSCVNNVAARHHQEYFSGALL